MLPPDPHSSGDADPLEPCFRSPAPNAGNDLADRVIARLRDEPLETLDDRMEEWIEASLAAWPVAPPSDFVARTIARLHQPTETVVIPWRLIPALVAGMAACLVLIFGLQPIENLRSDPPVDVSAETLSSFTAADPAVTIDTDVAQILALAESLDEPARWLLDESSFTTLVVAVE